MFTLKGSRVNPILLTDSYKVAHWRAYPPDLRGMFSYFESRGGMFDETVFYGLQIILEEYLQGEFVTQEDIEEAASIMKDHFGTDEFFNRAGWEYIVSEHNGMLPVEICAVPEGMVVPVSNVLMTVENTDPKCPWVTNYLESLLVQVWYPMTVATQAREIRKILYEALVKTGTPSLIDYKLHDFGFRGASSVETAAVGGSAHLTAFNGTDTMVALPLIREVYGARYTDANSIFATEHSTITSWGKSREKNAYEYIVKNCPEGTIACVMDSFDIIRAIQQYIGTDLRDEVMAREGVLVLRPDSGDPVVLLDRILDIIAERFGSRLNPKGFRVVNDKIRVIWGDGINYQSIKQIVFMLELKGWSLDNVSFGMGGAGLQMVNRDTQRVAFKASYADFGDYGYGVKKDPVTDPGKTSKSGRLVLIKERGQFSTVDRDVYSENFIAEKNVLQQKFLNGLIRKYHGFNEIRRRVREGC